MKRRTTMTSITSLKVGERDRISSVVPTISIIAMIPMKEKRLELPKNNWQNTKATIIPKNTERPPNTGIG